MSLIGPLQAARAARAVEGNLVGVSHYRREVHATREQVWATLTNHSGWKQIPALREWFGRVEWYEGEPWQEGSRIVIEHYWPTQTDIQLVVLSITPKEEFSWIGHGRGLTAHQQVRFEPLAGGQSRITSRMEYVLAEGMIDRSEAESVSDRLLRTFLDAIADATERQVPPAASDQ